MLRGVRGGTRSSSPSTVVSCYKIKSTRSQLQLLYSQPTAERSPEGTPTARLLRERPRVRDHSREEQGLGPLAPEQEDELAIHH